MKAIVYHEYGTPDVLALQDVDQPTPGHDDVLVRVRAASVNSWDWDLLTGTPVYARLEGLRRPKYEILGADIAGRVGGVGTNGERLRGGDDVFGNISGCGWGGYAEYVAVPEHALAMKSPAMTFEESALLQQRFEAGLAAYTYLAGAETHKQAPWGTGQVPESATPSARPRGEESRQLDAGV